MRHKDVRQVNDPGVPAPMIGIIPARLRSQQLDDERFRHPRDLVSYLGAVQAQDYAGAKWSVGMRLPGSTDADVDAAIAGKTILRTWAVRGTLHFVAAEDIRWLISLVAPFVIAGNARRYRELGLDQDTFDRSNTILSEVLSGGGALTRPELKLALGQRGISSVGQRAPYLLQRASLDGLICQTGMVRNQAVFALIEETVPEAVSRRYHDAGAELARRYFTSRGPATTGDFAWWSGLPAPEAKAGLEAAGPRLASMAIGGKTYWYDPALVENEVPSGSVRLLPTYDEYLVGYRDRAEIFGTKGTPPESLLAQKIIVHGRVAGTWKRSVRQGRVVVSKQSRMPFSPAEEDGFSQAALRYGEFLGMPVEIA